MEICPVCGTSNNADSSYCMSCGTSLVSNTPGSEEVTSESLSPVSKPAPIKPAHHPIPVKSAPIRRGFASVFFSVLICILCVVLLSFMLLPIMIHNTVKERSILSMLQRVELDHIPASIIDSTNEDLEDISLAEALCNALNKTLENEIPAQDLKNLTPGKLDDALDETSFLPFLARHISGFYNAMLDGKETYRIPEREIVDLIEENAEYLEDILRINMDQIDIEASAELFLEEEGLGEIMIYDLSNPEEREYRDRIATGFSEKDIVIPLAALLNLFALLVLINRKFPLIAVRDVGIVGLIAVAGHVLITAFSNLGSVLFAGKNAVGYLVCIFVSSVYNSSLILIGGIFVVSIALLVVSSILKKKKKAARI